MKDLHVVACVPSGEMWHADFAKAFVMLCMHFQKTKLAERSQRLSILNVKGSMLSQNRETAAEKALEMEATHLLWLDTDMVFPANTVQRLLAHGQPFVAANCAMKELPPKATAVGVDGERVVSLGARGLTRVQHVGLAVALLEAELFRQTPQPWFPFMWVEELHKYAGEDVSFCRKLLDRGVRLLVDNELSMEVFHVGSYRYGLGGVVNGDINPV